MQALSSCWDAEPARKAKSRWKLAFDGKRYVGYGHDVGREWVQFREGFDDPSRIQWPSWAEVHRDRLSDCYHVCDAVARTALRAVLPNGCRDVTPLTTWPVESDAQEDRFGPSVMRFLVYKDRPPGASNDASASGHHADMGLLSVLPPSTLPALEVWNTSTGTRVFPEQSLGRKFGSREWIVMAGETLAYLTYCTQNPIHAPVHRVPYVDRGRGDRRLAMPFFLRAAPSAILTPSNSQESMSCRELMERHAVGLRPWRLRNFGNGSGDW
eukprot:TRINITY_DN54991_c0_g1_i1.p1 TRINITY_DN54991_c0_g1~~TRINITY_DN54991_c0_g1_i1.p1  ORF type:complete len:309 (-),score=17.86 TRINITY_DN54991_c0_g1_i1:521-1327(-)